MTKDELIVLDMDSTLVSMEYFLHPSTYQNIQDFGSSIKIPFEETVAIFGSRFLISEYQYNIIRNNSYIFIRPYLHEFMEYLFENFTVALWTSAQKKWLD